MPNAYSKLAQDGIIRFPRTEDPELRRACFLRAMLPDLPRSAEVLTSLLRLADVAMLDAIIAHGLDTKDLSWSRVPKGSNLSPGVRAVLIGKLYLHWHSKETGGGGYGKGFEQRGPDVAITNAPKHPDPIIRFPRRFKT